MENDPHSDPHSDCLCGDENLNISQNRTSSPINVVIAEATGNTSKFFTKPA